MKKSYWGITTALMVCVLLCFSGCKDEQKKQPLTAVSASAVVDEKTTPVPSDKDGQALFQQNCAVCHPAGGNIINPLKALDGESLAANGIVTVGDIVDNMRQPGPGMTPFDKELLSDRDAGRIAEYILQTY